MRNLRGQRPLIGLLLVLLLSGVACHHPRSWQVVPHAPSIDPPKDDFTLVWDQKEDANGSPLNPYWGLEKTANEIPPREQGQHPYPCELDPFSSSCSENKTIIKDEPLFPNSLICSVGNLQAKIHGHADWIVASQEGCVEWEDQSVDGDYNFRLFPPNPSRSVLTKNNGGFIGLEFDYYETLVNAQLPFWQELRAEVQREDDDQRSHEPEIRRILRPAPQDPNINPRAAVLGLFGVDCEHGCKSEVHPVLALAVETNEDPNDNTWMLFVRNWGDQGFCSQYRHLVDFPNNEVSVLLFDDANSDGATVIPEKTKMFASAGSGVVFPAFKYWTGHGPVITFSFPPPEQQQAFVEMEIHYKWNKLTPPSCKPPTPSLSPPRTAQANVEPQNAEEYLAQVHRKWKAEQPAAHKSFMMAQEKPRFALERVATPQSMSVSTFTPPAKVAMPKPAKLPQDASKRQRDAASIQALCNQYNGHLPPFRGQDLSAKLCNQKKLQKLTMSK